MDHWGDPWADDADTNANIAAPAKVAHSPLRTPTHDSSINKPVPILLNGFLDDAGWGSNEWVTTPSPRKDADGSEDVERAVIGHAQDWDAHSTQKDAEAARVDGEYEGSGAWAVQPASDDDVHTPTNTGTNGWDDAPNWETSAASVKEEGRMEELSDAANNQGGIEEAQSVKSEEHGQSETSDTATMTQADDASRETAKDITTSIHPEDDTSTRSSVSQSERSHNEALLESPRTSVEEERTTEESARNINDEEKVLEEIGEIIEHQESSEPDGEDEFGDFEEETDQEAAGIQLDEVPPTDQSDSTLQKDEMEMPSQAQAMNSVSPARPPPISTDGFVLDPQLMAELFAPEKDAPKLEEPSDDPVSSTSTRKAWYRLTRKQTMREYNNGALDDNYIRITWKTSHIRTEVNKTIVRWANEDRIAGRGPGARASFFWDSTAAPDTKAHAALHARNKSSIAGSKPVQPVREALPQLSTDIPAAFNWSSPLPATQMTPDGSGARVASAPVTAKHSAVTRLQRQGGRAVSVDLSPRPKEPASHKRTSTATDFEFRKVSPPVHASPITPIQAPPGGNFDPWSSSTTSSPVIPISAGPPPQADEHFDPWANLGALDTSTPPKQDISKVEDDDDDWGDMVESPAVSSIHTPISTLQTPTAELSGSTIRNEAMNLTTSTTPEPVRASPVPEPSLPTGPTQASRIMRLQGTVSPTSALFKPNALVPTDSQERIGPHLLRKTNRSRESTPEKAKAAPVLMPTMDEVLANEPSKEENVEPEFATPAATTMTTTSPASTPTPELPPAQNDTQLEQAPTVEGSLPTYDDQPNWGNDADFSIFESALPSAPASAPTTTQPDASDPWSIFNTPAPSEPPAPFSRPAARSATPPALQPLTGATNSAQRRKADEDNVVRGIVEGLPDLRYMLRR